MPFLSKQRILELYANVIELGDGIYGIEAGARFHFGLKANQLNRNQLARLIAIMPNPRLWDPNHLYGRGKSRAQMILTELNQIDGEACSKLDDAIANGSLGSETRQSHER